MEEERKWGEMEMDCLINIFDRLSLEDKTLSTPFVCRSWYKISLDPTCYQFLNFRELDFMPWSKFSKEFTRRYGLSELSFSLSGILKLCVSRSHGSVMEIEFPQLFGVDLEDLTYISYECPKLRKLVLPNITLEQEKNLPEIISRWPELERLEMEAKPSSFQKMIDKIDTNCTNFTRLKMFGSFKKDDVSVIINRVPRIKQLFLSKSFLLKEDLFAILKGCSFLEELIVRDCVGFEICEEDLKWVSHKIRVFEYEGSRLIENFDFDTDVCDPQDLLIM